MPVRFRVEERSGRHEIKPKTAGMTNRQAPRRERLCQILGVAVGLIVGPDGGRRQRGEETVLIASHPAEVTNIGAQVANESTTVAPITP